MGLDFAKHLLERLETRSNPPPTEAVNGEADGTPSEQPKEQQEVEESPVTTNGVEHASDSARARSATVQAGKIMSGLPAAKTETEVAQHIELLFGLVSKAPDLLDRYVGNAISPAHMPNLASCSLFNAYPHMSPEVQAAIQTLSAPLIKALGASHAKIQSILRTYPPASEDLVLRMIMVLTQNGKLPPVLSNLVKEIALERDINPRFMVPIIADLDKAEILKHLPRIISLLNGKQAEKELIRGVFSSVVTTPPQSFGSVTTNVARVRQSELLTPVELLALLHQAEKEIGIKQAIEAIGICFSMTDAFRPEVLGAFMQQIVDEATLPTLFLRTVIQAVTTYKSLQPYVSNTLLSRLITKKVWTMPQLWQGFIRCAKVIAPNSFGAILQLPREQIKELVTKQPDLKEGLKEYVLKSEWVLLAWRRSH